MRRHLSTLLSTLDIFQASHLESICRQHLARIITEIWTKTRRVGNFSRDSRQLRQYLCCTQSYITTSPRFTSIPVLNSCINLCTFHSDMAMLWSKAVVLKLTGSKTFYTVLKFETNESTLFYTNQFVTQSLDNHPHSSPFHVFVKFVYTCL